MRLFAPLALSAALLLGACQNPDGSVNVPASIALGAGIALAGVAIASANDSPRRHDDRRGYYRHRHGHGYGRHYSSRGW